jgi:hypothetical protein
MFVRSTPLRAASRKFILLPPREMRVQFQPPEPPPSRTVSFNETTTRATEAQDSPPPPQSDGPVMRIPVE